MDVQFFGANCVTVTYKGVRVVIDDNLEELGAKSVTRAENIAVYTMAHGLSAARLLLDGPGEYEVSDVSIMGITARAHIDEQGQHGATMFKLIAGESSVLITGHIYPELSDATLEAIGLVDVLLVPVGGSGYTLDPIGALKIIKAIEPKVVVPTHYADKSLHYPVPQLELATALQELAMEPKETVTRLRLKPGELSDVTQLVILEKA